jgi:hypothetical protein
MVYCAIFEKNLWTLFFIEFAHFTYKFNSFVFSGLYLMNIDILVAHSSIFIFYFIWSVLSTLNNWWVIAVWHKFPYIYLSLVYITTKDLAWFIIWTFRQNLKRFLGFFYDLDWFYLFYCSFFIAGWNLPFFLLIIISSYLVIDFLLLSFKIFKEEFYC